jgi:hypothetical protein
MQKMLGALGALFLCACAGTAAPATAAGKPTSLSISSETVTEGQVARPVIRVAGGNGKPLGVSWRLSDGRAGYVIVSRAAPAVIELPMADDALVNGARVLALTAVSSSSTGAKASAILTVLDNDVAPPPPPVTPAGTATAKEACPAINRPESAIAGRNYKVEATGVDPTAGPFVVLSDADHPGDGWYALYLPISCVDLG